MQENSELPQLAMDLDGTLISTYNANLAAYRHIGVTPPADFDKIMWYEWTDAATHARKGAIFSDFVQECETLPLYKWLEQPLPFHIVSACSHEVWIALAYCFPLLRKATSVQIGVVDKVEAVRHIGQTGILFDDNRKHVKAMNAADNGWRGILV